MIDAIAHEPHFVDHIAPIWLALPPEARGTFFYTGRAACRDVPRLVRKLPPRSGHHTLTASAGDLFKSRKLGRPTAIMEHGCGQSFGGARQGSEHASYAGGRGRDAQLFLHPGPHPAARDRARHPDARIEVVGCARLDELPRKSERNGLPVVAVGFHWDAKVCMETRSAAPEFIPPLELLVKSGRYHVIGHAHPRIMDRLAPAYEKRGVEVVRSFDEVCRRADVYLNDASSTLFEFASTGRPVVVLNATFYRRKVNHGLRFWEASIVGLNAEVSDARRLGAIIDNALADPPAQKERRERALDMVYAYRSGAAARAAGVLMDWAR